ncbi:MAG: hypothetical protein ACTHK7_11430 [Aureliella sp.]
MSIHQRSAAQSTAGGVARGLQQGRQRLAACRLMHASGGGSAKARFSRTRPADGSANLDTAGALARAQLNT